MRHLPYELRFNNKLDFWATINFMRGLIRTMEYLMKCRIRNTRGTDLDKS